MVGSTLCSFKPQKHKRHLPLPRLTLCATTAAAAATHHNPTHIPHIATLTGQVDGCSICICVMKSDGRRYPSNAFTFALVGQSVP